MTCEVTVQNIKLLRRERLVHRAPPDVVSARRFAHNELIVRRPARVGRRHTHERAGLSDGAFATSNSALNERVHAEIPVDG